MEKVGKFFLGIMDSFYNTLIYDNRYKYILEGLFNTIIIALFAVAKEYKYINIYIHEWVN